MHNNRLTVPAGFSLTYDTAGNVITDTLAGAADARVYDAENRMIEARGGLSQYRYNADGQRVRRYEAPMETWQVYGFEGELLAEYPSGGAPANPQKEYGYRNGELLITAEPAGAQENQQQPSMNVALQSNGATASASSELDSGRTALAAINGDRKGQHWGTDPATGSGWHCATHSAYPDTLEIVFSGTKTISEVDIFAVQDSWTSPVEPTESMTASIVGVTQFVVEYWNGSTWATIPGTNVSGNTKVWRKFTFAPINTSKIKVSVTGAQNYYSRLAEVEAWTPAPAPNPRLNVALEANGCSATCSTYQNSGTAPRGAINGDRKGIHWGSDPATGSGWHDATNGTWPDWIEVQFASAKVIDELNVISVQDDPGNPIEPTLSTTFTQYGASQFKAYYWNGTTWVPIPGIENVTGNNKVWRKFTFAPITTTRIKLEVSASPNQTWAHSRVVELEAFGTNAPEASTGSSSNVYWLVPDQLGTPRMIIDQSGSLTRHDYLPFGEEIVDEVGLFRTSDNGYSGNDGVRQKFTSKDRDLETGLDYFLARYYSAAQGRFTSPDPLFIQKEMLSDPQRFNLYGYVRNSPLTLVDPTGEAIELTGDATERAKKLELLRKMVGAEAGAYLYENVVDGKYFVGIYTNGPDGKGKDFGSINASAGNLVPIIGDRLIAEIQLIGPGTYDEVGTIAAGKSPGVTGVDQDGRARIFLLDPGTAPGSLPAELTSNGLPLPMETSDVLAHEMGHVAARWGLTAGSYEGVAIAFENDARKVRNPGTPTRESYKTKGDLKTREHGFKIPFRRWPR